MLLIKICVFITRGKILDSNNTKNNKNNKLKIIAQTWNDEFQLPDGSYSVPDV